VNGEDPEDGGGRHWIMAEFDIHRKIGNNVTMLYILGMQL